MKPLDLREFAEQLRLQGCEFADEILELVELEAAVAEPYFSLCDDLNHHAPDGLKDKPEKQLEWLGDRSDVLKEIEEALETSEALHSVAPNGRAIRRDTDDAVKEALAILEDIKLVLVSNGAEPEGDILDQITDLAARAASVPIEPVKMEYDL